MYGCIFFMLTLDLTQFPRGAIGEEEEEDREEAEMAWKASAEQQCARNRKLAQRAAMAKRAEEGEEVGKDSPPRYL